MLSLVQMRRLYVALWALVLFSFCPESTPGPAIQKVLEMKVAGYSLILEYPAIPGASDALIHLEEVEDDPIPFEEYARNLAEERAKNSAKNSAWHHFSLSYTG